MHDTRARSDETLFLPCVVGRGCLRQPFWEGSVGREKGAIRRTKERKWGGDPGQRGNEDKWVSPSPNGKQCPGRRPPFAKTAGGNGFAAGAMTDFSGAGTLPLGRKEGGVPVEAEGDRRGGIYTTRIIHQGGGTCRWSVVSLKREGNGKGSRYVVIIDL